MQEMQEVPTTSGYAKFVRWLMAHSALCESAEHLEETNSHNKQHDAPVTPKACCNCVPTPEPKALISSNDTEKLLELQQMDVDVYKELVMKDVKESEADEISVLVVLQSC